MCDVCNMSHYNTMYKVHDLPSVNSELLYMAQYVIYSNHL